MADSVSKRGPVKKVIGWLLVAVLFFAIAMVLMAPAQKLYALAAPQLAPLQLDGIAGNAWRGTAARGRYEQTALEKIAWKFQPTKLLMAKLGYGIEGKVAGARIDGDISTRGKALTVSDTVVTWTLEQLLKEVKAPPQIGTLAGQLTVQAEKIVLAEQRLVSLSGEAVVASLKHAGLKNVDLGDFKLVANTTEDGLTTVTANDLRGVLEMDITFTLDAEQKFTAKGLLKPRADAPREMNGLLLLFGRRQPDGSFVVDRSGQIPAA